MSELGEEVRMSAEVSSHRRVDLSGLASLGYLDQVRFRSSRRGDAEEASGFFLMDKKAAEKLAANQPSFLGFRRAKA